MALRDRDYMRPPEDLYGEEPPPRPKVWVVIVAVLVVGSFLLAALRSVF
jgi:hypothetical protein